MKSPNGCDVVGNGLPHASRRYMCGGAGAARRGTPRQRAYGTIPKRSTSRGMVSGVILVMMRRHARADAQFAKEPLHVISHLWRSGVDQEAIDEIDSGPVHPPPVDGPRHAEIADVVVCEGMDHNPMLRDQGALRDHGQGADDRSGRFRVTLSPTTSNLPCGRDRAPMSHS